MNSLKEKIFNLFKNNILINNYWKGFNDNG